jgi:L-2-hydroxyglutarate oxidase LhgO
MLDTEVLVIGAGVVGLAVAAELSRRGKAVVVIEREGMPGSITSSRNSGVIHAGIYYPAGSLKAQTCIEGRQLLYERAARLGIAHRKTGKLIVAVTRDEGEYLADLRERATAIGVPLALLDEKALRAREPDLRGVLALSSPESGVVDAHGLVESFRAEARDHGAEIAFRTWPTHIESERDAVRVQTDDARGERLDLRAGWVINAAGLDADRVASLAGLDVDALGYRIHPSKGDYFVLGAGAPRPKTSLVYPVPHGVGLGIHLTVDLGGRCLAGPDATFVDARDDYGVDASKAPHFAASVARYLPGVSPEHLTPDYAGIRPRLAGPDDSFRDFVIEEATPHGMPRLVNLLGIESPGLTASPAIARRVARIVASN